MSPIFTLVAAAGAASVDVDAGQTNRSDAGVLWLPAVKTAEAVIVECVARAAPAWQFSPIGSASVNGPEDLGIA